MEESTQGSIAGEVVIGSGKSLTIETIGEFLTSIRQGLAEAESVVIDFDPEVEVDITSLQVFCSACRTARAQGKRWTYRGPLPQALTDLIVAAGFQRLEDCEYMNGLCFRQSGGME